MKTLQNQTILYDEDCPLCQVYTSAFVKTGMLDKNGRKPYNQINEKETAYLNLERAANEIALIDYKNKTVVYGIDSLLRIIGNSFPIIEKTGKIPPVNYLLKKLYSFISYNRKVIIPNGKTTETKLQCEPTFDLKYRIFYILFAICITTIVLFNCAEMMPYIPKSSYSREVFMAGGQILFQVCFLFNKDFKTIINYLGNLMTVSLYGCLLLIPILIINQFTEVNAAIALSWFAVTVLLIFMEHVRRIAIQQLPKYLSFTWVLYRIIALYLILNITL
ncbi:DCC1-like thiol-disulfide oxidoreductase family protein [Flavobacterium sp. H122]|uniref:DCC1-like thiol-disulfide oxidoreductase family protein n=1 Tax=Flavobacterium sp. H122 TaxID=2529860 RepID=UPI0010AA2003|nr:DCC1-like thiol-disulfide oxidoreductase family protein [Flavobacterium sp. H122]